MAKINVLDKDVTIYVQNDEDYICLTDIAGTKTLIVQITLSRIGLQPDID